MKKSLCYLILGLSVILFISLTGCVAPPAAPPVTPVSNYDPNQLATTQTPVPNGSGYVTEVTPFVLVTAVDTRITYNTLQPVTQTPREKSCRIYTKTQTYAYNGSAFTYDLKNPPMYINYSVIPKNYTEKRLVTSKTGTRKESVIEIDTYSPYSWLEITIRNKTTGEIYQQDGFGKDHSTYLKNTMKVNKMGDLLIELKGNLITATVDFWVKPDINFEDPQQVNSTVCTEIEQTRVSLPYTTMTATPTWTG
jgi:hypothetical protein